MNCEVEIRDGAIRIHGEMNIYSAATLKEQMIEALDAQTGESLVNMEDVSELDTAGVQILIVAQRYCTARGASFKITNPSAVVRDTLELLRVHSLPFSSTAGDLS
jgi:anti-anti-sigma factor